MGANSVGTLSVTVAGNASPMMQEFAKAQKGIQSFNNSVNATYGKMNAQKLGGGMSAGFGKLVAGSALGNLAALNVTGALGSLQEMVTSTVDLASKFEQANTAFGVLVGDVEKGKATVASLQQLAVETPFQSKDLIDNGRALLGMGVRAEQLVPVLSRLGDVAQGDAEKLQRLALQFGQVMSSTQFKKEEFNIFAEIGADVSEFAKAAGFVGPDAMQKLFAAFEKGAVGSDVMVKGFNAMTSAGGRFAGMNDKMSATFGGQLNSFLEKVDLLKIKVGTAFLQGFKPGQLLDGLADSMGLDKLEAKLTPFFEKLRFGFDMVRGVALSYSSVMLKDVQQGLGVLFDSAPKWEVFKAAAISATRGVITGLGSLVNANNEFRHEMADMISELSNAAKSFGAELKNAAQFIPGKIGRGMEASGKALSLMGQAGGKYAEIARPSAKRGEDVRPEMLAKFDGFLDNLERMNQVKPMEPPKGRGLIEVPQVALKMSPAAESFYKDAINKPPTNFGTFEAMALHAREAARFNPQNTEAINMHLADKFLGMNKQFFANMEVKLPTALKAGSAETESIISQAMSQTEARNDIQSRIEQAVKQARDINDRQLQELKEVSKALRAMNFQAVGF
jgi:hypothetical protein